MTSTDSLQNLLIDLIDLVLQTRQAHWNVTGPRFRFLHLQLDEFTTEQNGWIDQLAERLAALGVPPAGQAKDLAGGLRLQPLPEGTIPGDQAVVLMLTRLEGVAGSVAAALDGDTDPVTGDLLTRILAGLEHEAWLLRAQQ